MSRPSIPADRARRLAERGRATIERIRPRTRAGIAKVVAGAVVIVAVVSVGLFVLGTATVAFYDQYGYHPERNAQVWAAREPAYAEAGICRSCHGLQANLQVASRHRTVACDSCHGALDEHATGDPVAALPLATPRPDICATCHAAAAGRPAGFPQVDLATHYTSGVCLGCHDSHSTAALRPPVVSHPLDRLPVCTTCHKADGLKRLPVGHEPAADAVCLGCHAAGADGGVADDEGDG